MKTEWCIADDDSVVEAGFWSEHEAGERLAELAAVMIAEQGGDSIEDVGLIVAKRADYGPPKRTVRNSDGITSCCGRGYSYVMKDGERFEFCSECQQPVQLRIVKTDDGELLMMAGAQPCGDSMPVPRTRKRRKPHTTVRHGRRKARK